MSIQIPVTPVLHSPAPHHEPASRASEEIAVQVRLEYAKFLEKRNAIRKSIGQLRRTMIHATLLS